MPEQVAMEYTSDSESKRVGFTPDTKKQDGGVAPSRIRPSKTKVDDDFSAIKILSQLISILSSSNVHPDEALIRGTIQTLNDCINPVTSSSSMTAADLYVNKIKTKAHATKRDMLQHLVANVEMLNEKMDQLDQKLHEEEEELIVELQQA